MLWYNEIMKNYLMLTLYSILSAVMISLCFLTNCFTLVWQIIFTVAIALTLVALFLGKLKYGRIYKACVVIFVAEIIILAIYIALFYSGLLSHFSSIEAAQEWFASFGAWAWLIFFVVQLLQVVVLPIPAQITTVAGIVLLGPWKTFFISSVAVIVGSFIAFAFGKFMGIKVAYKIAKKETVDKYRKVLDKKGRMILPIMFLFPLFPDDLLCFIAGTTTMSWLYFSVVTIVTRLIGIACTCFFLSGDVIPFEGWGIPVWIVIAIALVVASVVLLKYQDKIEKFIINKFTKQSAAENPKAPEELENEAEIKKGENYVAFSDEKDGK